MSALPEAKLDVLLAHHASLEAQVLGRLSSEKYVQITRELSEHACGLSIFTPEEVASRFSPPHRARRRHKEVTAAKKALQHLADQGVLICQQVKGTWQCFND